MRKLLLIIVTFIILMCSCSSTKLIEVPVETIRTEYITSIMVDTILEKDSIDRWMKGDTVYIYKEHTKYRYLNRTDTVCKTDTITKVVKVDVVKEVEVNHIYWYQKALMWAGVVAMALIASFVFFFKMKF